MLMPGKHVNPVLKAVTDIATNPFVIMGLIVGMWKFPIGSTEPILALRRGLLPKAAAMGPISSYVHDAMMNLRTHPGLFDKMFKVLGHQSEFISKHGLGKIGAIFKEAGPITKEESLAVSAMLDGLNTADHSMVMALRDTPEWAGLMGGRDVPIAAGLQGKISPRVQKIADKLRTALNGMWDDLLGDPEKAARVQAELEHQGLQMGGFREKYFPRSTQYDKYYQSSIRGVKGTEYRTWMHKADAEAVGGEVIERTGLSFANADHLRRLESAGIIPKGFTDMEQGVLRRWASEASTTAERIWSDIERMGIDEGQQRKEFIRQMSEYYTKGAGKQTNFVARLGSPKRAADTLDAMAGALQTAKFRGPSGIQEELLEIGKTLSNPAEYSLDPYEALGRYTNSAARTYSWHGTGLGKEIMEIVDRPGEFTADPHSYTYVADNIIPHLRGYKAYPQMVNNLNYLSTKQRIYNWVDKHPLVEKTLGPDRKQWILGHLKDTKALSSPEALGGAVARNFYLSTLGLNLGSSAKNALQTYATTLNVVGPQGIWRGLKGVPGGEGLLPKMERYAASIAKGIENEKAFSEAFPEFVKDAGDAARITSGMLEQDIEREGLKKFVSPSMLDKARNLFMLPFKTTEAGNRLLAYYAGRNSHLFQNAAQLASASAGEREAILTAAGEVGQSLNWISNFPGGPLGVPKALMNLNPMWRQFAHFPLRFIGFIQGSARLGADPSKVDFGTFGRMLAGSTAAYIGARDLLGVDISGGLLTGALPVPEYEKSPFYPFPFVPPVAQLAGSAAMGLLKGDMGALKSSASMLVPGGVALSRAYRTFSPRYADYENPTPEGRVPLYDRNKALIGTLSPMELTLRASGLRPSSVSAEVGAAKWLMSQRDRLRQYRRDYTQAVFENDPQKADRINKEFQRVYPELGPLQVKKTDLKALEDRREMSRILRIERAIPKAYRPLFASVIGEAGLNAMTSGVQLPDLGGLQNFSPQQ
jgi:hypothetical protein